MVLRQGHEDTDARDPLRDLIRSAQCRRLFRSRAHQLGSRFVVVFFSLFMLLFLSNAFSNAVQHATENQAPTVANQPIYRAIPGHTIALPIVASDPEQGSLSYMASDLPEGAMLDPNTGVFHWTPTEDDLGPDYARFTVADDGTPPQSTPGYLIFQIRSVAGQSILTGAFAKRNLEL